MLCLSRNNWVSHKCAARSGSHSNVCSLSWCCKWLESAAYYLSHPYVWLKPPKCEEVKSSGEVVFIQTFFWTLIFQIFQALLDETEKMRHFPTIFSIMTENKLLNAGPFLHHILLNPVGPPLSLSILLFILDFDRERWSSCLRWQS